VYIAPLTGDRSGIEVRITEGSERLERLTPFAAWDGLDPTLLPILLKAEGKCTTDHISAAGPWLKYRGHLTNISGNLYLTANNQFTEGIGLGIHQTSGKEMPLPELARTYRAEHQDWVVFGDENFGEGSSREHAAMEPRLQGCRAIIVRSFARIHETNLKKQGILPLTFQNPADYDKVRAGDLVTLSGVTGLAPGSAVEAILQHADGATDTLPLRHTLNADQIGWFRAGSALNKIREANG
jgi:aconitate hydratase